MSETQTVTINTGDEGAKGPSLQEQYDALVKEGLIAPDGDTPGADEAGKAQEKKDAKKGSNDERPSWLPEKFKDEAAFRAAYDELERKQAQGKKPEAGAGDGANKPTAEERKAAEEATKKAGLDLGAVSREYLNGGKLTDDTYAKLGEAGYPREMVDIYIEGLSARAASATAAAYEAVGGEQAYGEMIDWAIKNLPEDEQEAFDEAVNSNNKAKALIAIRGLKASMDAAKKAEASEEPETNVNAKGATSSTVYETMDDYMEDLNDPKYDTSETFRRKVMAKLGRSKIM